MRFPTQLSMACFFSAEFFRITEEDVLALCSHSRAPQVRAWPAHGSVVRIKTWCPRAMGTGEALCAATGCLEDVAQDARSINESGPILQSLGWTNGLPLRALALTKRTVSVCCLRLQRKASERSQQCNNTLFRARPCGVVASTERDKKALLTH